MEGSKLSIFGVGSLAGAKDIPDYLKNNIAQAGSVGFGYRPELFKLIRVADLPFLSPKSDALARAASEIVDENKKLKNEFEGNGLKLLCLEVAERSPIASREAARKVDDMKGWKVRAYGQFAVIIQSWGATPLSMPFSDIPEGLERGVIDASTAIYFTSYDGMKLPEIINYAIDTGERFATFIGMCMSLKFYNSLPNDLKSLVDNMAKKSWYFWAEKYAEEVVKNAKVLAKTKMEFITWSPKAIKRAKELCAPAADKMYFDEMKKRGVEAEARAIYKELAKRAKKYEPESILPYSFGLVKKYRKGKLRFNINLMRYACLFSQTGTAKFTIKG